MVNESFFRLATAAIFISGLGISGYFRARANLTRGTVDQGFQLVIVLRLLGLLFIWPLLAYLINPAWVAWARWDVPPGLRLLFLGLAAATVPVIFWIFYSIRTNISPAHGTRRDHQLITSGPYRYIRHPLYTFGFLFFFSISIATALWWLSLGLLLLAPVIAWRTPKEEAALIAKFGLAYRSYISRTGRYVPKLGSPRHQ